MKFFSLLALALILSCCSSKQELKPTMYLERQVPPAQLTLMKGESDMIGRSGRPEVVLFWASWCSGSLSQLSEMESLARESASNTRFIAVSIDDEKDSEQLMKRLEDKEIQAVEVAYSGNGVQDQAYLQLRGQQIPLVLGISDRGRVRYVGDDASDALSRLR